MSILKGGHTARRDVSFMGDSGSLSKAARESPKSRHFFRIFVAPWNLVSKVDGAELLRCNHR